ANGILHVAAKDRATGKEQSIRIEASSGLSESEIQRMVKDAEAHATEDRRSREDAEARNRGDQLVYEVEKNLKEHGGKLDAETRGKVDEAVKGLQDALKAGATEGIASATERLQTVWSEAASQLYASAGASAQPQGGEPGSPKKGSGEGGAGAVDADFEVVN